MSADWDPSSYDLVWLAVDAANQVAAFVTAGPGPIPLNILDPDLLDDVEERILDLPVVSRVRIPSGSDDGLGSFVALAQRGIFVYDWTDVHGTRVEDLHAYELVAAPTDPITVANLPHALTRIAAANQLSGERFAAANTLDVCRFVRCYKPD